MIMFESTRTSFTRQYQLIRRSITNLVSSGTATNIQEVGRGASVQLDDVHGGHGQPGAVHHAPNVAVQGDVVEVEVGGLDFTGVLLGPVALNKKSTVSTHILNFS